MNRLYRVKPDLPTEERVVILRNGIDPNETLWLVGERPGSGVARGEKYGTFDQTLPPDRTLPPGNPGLKYLDILYRYRLPIACNSIR